ncbi:hypothetical protein ACFLVR_04500 [Chloroflexota bacterium]
MATAAPAMATESSQPASVTVNSFVAVTITDTAGGGVTFGAVDPDGLDKAETNQPGAAAIVITVELESNITVISSTKAMFADYGNLVSPLGTDDAGASNTVLTDTASGDFVNDGVVAGDYVYNTTDGSYGVVTSVTATTVTTVAALTGGTLNTWTSGDGYRISDDATLFAVTNGKWDSDSDVSGATGMTTSFAQIASTGVTGGDVDVDVYLWLAVPVGTTADTYYTNYVFKGDVSL